MFEEPVIFKDSSFINSVVIRDSDIFKSVGYENYVMLNRKFPEHFTFFDECYIENENIGSIPGSINLFIVGDALTIKSDIVKTIYYNKWISENSRLVLKCKNLVCEPTEIEYNCIIWILISIIMVVLFVIATYILISNPISNNIINSNFINIKYF